MSKKNITKKEEVKELIKSVCTRPVGGVFHLAVVCRHATIFLPMILKHHFGLSLFCVNV